MVGKNIAAGMAVESNGFGNGDGQLGQQPLRRRSNFTAIEGGGEDESVDNSDLGRPVPWHSLEIVALSGGFSNPVVESSAT